MMTCSFGGVIFSGHGLDNFKDKNGSFREFSASISVHGEFVGIYMIESPVIDVEMLRSEDSGFNMRPSAIAGRIRDFFVSRHSKLKT